MLRIIAFFRVFLSLSLFVATAAQCQNEVIEREEAIRVQSLSGRVRLGDSPEGVKGVLVEYCTRDWKVVTASTLTDEIGRFSFPNVSKKQLHYLRLSFHGAHTLLIKVRIDPLGGKELVLVLSFST